MHRPEQADREDVLSVKIITGGVADALKPIVLRASDSMAVVPTNNGVEVRVNGSPIAFASPRIILDIEAEKA